MRTLCFACLLFTTLSVFKVTALNDLNNSYVYNELVKTLNEKQIDYIEDPLRILLYTKNPVPGGTLLITSPIRAEIEIDETLPWIHQILIQFIEKIKTDNIDFDITIIFLDGDSQAQQNSDDFSENFGIQILLDTYETDDKVVLIDTNFFSIPSKIDIQKARGLREVPFELAYPFFSACRTLNISTSITGIQKSTLFDLLDNTAWDYDFPVISLNSDSRRSLFVPSLNTISKETMSDMFVMFAENVMSNPSTDYDRNYLHIGFISFNFFIQEYIIVLTILFGGTAVFFVFALFFLYKIQN
jgi:hypothetical protein